MDMVVVYSDGLVVWKKNEDGIYTDMGELLYIYGGISQAFVFHVDSDEYHDIAVLGSNNTLRIYTNSSGRFSVDGYPVCVNSQIPPNPPFVKGSEAMQMNQYSQRFIRDMDKDKRDDLVLHTT